MEITPPCGKACSDRHTHCHASCPRWAAYAAVKQARDADRLREKLAAQELTDARRRKVYRALRNRRSRQFF